MNNDEQACNIEERNVGSWIIPKIFKKNPTTKCPNFEFCKNESNTRMNNQKQNFKTHSTKANCPYEKVSFEIILLEFCYEKYLSLLNNNKHIQNINAISSTPKTFDNDGLKHENIEEKHLNYEFIKTIVKSKLCC